MNIIKFEFLLYMYISDIHTHWEIKQQSTYLQNIQITIRWKSISVYILMYTLHISQKVNANWGLVPFLSEANLEMVKYYTANLEVV